MVAERQQGMIFRGQNKEDQHIVGYFRASGAPPFGTFLDIGAADFETFSNTKLLWELGWSGVLVEPDPYSIRALLEAHASLPRIELICAAFGKANGLLRFMNSAGGLVSTSDPAHYKKWKSGSAVQFRPMSFPTVTVSDIEAIGGSHYDFVNLDVEGTNAELLPLLPLAKWGTRMICVEHDNREAEMLAYLKTQGLTRLITRSAENIIAAR